jgi:hypothetical protein
MSRNLGGILVRSGLALTVMLCLTPQARSGEEKTDYPKLAPVDHYMMERNAEIALARTAAPPSISKDADVMVLGRRGYESAAKGTNGFVCIVERSWTANSDDPVFWNPKLRAPICFNPAAARTYLPIVVRKTELILGGKSKEEMFDTIRAAFDKKALPLPERNSMCYMMSSQQYLGDEAKRWHPHLMFFVPLADKNAWGAGVSGSPIISAPDVDDHLITFMIVVDKWSDGTTAPPMEHE